MHTIFISYIYTCIHVHLRLINAIAIFVVDRLFMVSMKSIFEYFFIQLLILSKVLKSTCYTSSLRIYKQVYALIT